MSSSPGDAPPGNSSSPDAATRRRSSCRTRATAQPCFSYAEGPVPGYVRPPSSKGYRTPSAESFEEEEDASTAGLELDLDDVDNQALAASTARRMSRLKQRIAAVASDEDDESSADTDKVPVASTSKAATISQAKGKGKAKEKEGATTKRTRAKAKDRVPIDFEELSYTEIDRLLAALPADAQPIELIEHAQQHCSKEDVGRVLLYLLTEVVQPDDVDMLFFHFAPQLQWASNIFPGTFCF